MRRFLSLLFLFCFSISFFTACSKKDFTVIDNSDTLDFMGEKVVIAEGTYIWHFPISKGTTASSDRELERYAVTEKVFNLKFDYLLDINPEIQFLAAAMSGGIQADLLLANNYQVYGAYLINTLFPVETVISDPESDKWKSPANNAKALYGGKMYGIFPNYWESAPGVCGMININLDALDEYDITDPHEIIESGEWNWNNFRVFLQKTKFEDGEKEWLGMGMGINGVGVACIFPFVLSNGGSFLKESNGRYQLNIDCPEAMEAYEFIADLGTNGLITQIPVDDPDYLNGDKWMLTSGGPSSSSKFNMAQIRYPYGPSGNKDTVTIIASGFFLWAFPIFSAYTEEEEVGEVAEFLFEPLSDIYPNGWKDCIGETVFYYDSECDYFIKGIEKAEYIDSCITADSFWMLSNAMLDLANGNQSPANAIDAIFDVINEEINEKYNR